MNRHSRYVFLPTENAMPARLTALGLSLSLAACAAVPPPPSAEAQTSASARLAAAVPAQRGEAITGEAGRDLARRLLATLADDVVEVRRAWSGPGYYLHGFDLWERPTPAPYPNVCQIRVHHLGLGGLTQAARHDPDAGLNPDARAESISTEARFRAVGSVLSVDTAPRPGLASESACAGLNSRSGFFRAPSASDAYNALQAFEHVQEAARRDARMINLECVSFEQPCTAPRDALMALRAQQIAAVRRIPCDAGGAPDCWEIDLRPEGAAPWALMIHRLQRPMRVVLRQDQPPVV